MNTKTRLISLLGAVAFVGVMGTQSIAIGPNGELDDFPFELGVLSKVVDHLPTKDITPFALSTTKARAAVQSNGIVKYFKVNDMRPEPTIPILQAMFAKGFYIDHEVAGYLFRDVSRKLAKATKAREDKLMEAHREREAKNHERVETLEEEAQKLEKEVLFYERTGRQLNADFRKFRTLAWDLGDSKAIQLEFGNCLKWDRVQNPPTTTAVTFLEPLVARGFVTARQLKRNFLIEGEQRDVAILINEELRAEGYIEPFRFKRNNGLFNDDEAEELRAKVFQLKDHEYLVYKLARAGTVDDFRELLANFRINSSTLRLVSDSLADSNKELNDITRRMARGYRNSDKLECKFKLELYKGFIEVLKQWLVEHEAKFQKFKVCQAQTEEEAKLQAEFTTLINGCEDKASDISEAVLLFENRMYEFKTVSQLAVLLSVLPNETTADHLRSMIVDRIKELQPEWREVEGIYTFLVSGGGKFDSEPFNLLPSATKQFYQIAAFKYARLIGYVPPDMR